MRNVALGSNSRRDEPYPTSFDHNSRDRAHEKTSVNTPNPFQVPADSRPQYSVPSMPVAQNADSEVATVSSGVGAISLSASHTADLSAAGRNEQIFRNEWPPFTAEEADRDTWWHLAKSHCRNAWGSHINLSSLPMNPVLRIGRNDEEIKAHFTREAESAWEDVEKGILACEALRPGGRCQDLELIVSAEVHHRAHNWATSNGSRTLWYEGKHICHLSEASKGEQTQGIPWRLVVSRASSLPKRSRDGEKAYATYKADRRREQRRLVDANEPVRLIPDVDKALR